MTPITEDVKSGIKAWLDPEASTLLSGLSLTIFDPAFFCVGFVQRQFLSMWRADPGVAGLVRRMDQRANEDTGGAQTLKSARIAPEAA